MPLQEPHGTSPSLPNPANSGDGDVSDGEGSEPEADAPRAEPGAAQPSLCCRPRLAPRTAGVVVVVAALAVCEAARARGWVTATAVGAATNGDTHSAVGPLLLRPRRRPVALPGGGPGNCSAAAPRGKASAFDSSKQRTRRRTRGRATPSSLAALALLRLLLLLLLLLVLLATTLGPEPTSEPTTEPAATAVLVSSERSSGSRSATNSRALRRWRPVGTPAKAATCCTSSGNPASFASGGQLCLAGHNGDAGNEADAGQGGDAAAGASRATAAAEAGTAAVAAALVAPEAVGSTACAKAACACRSLATRAQSSALASVDSKPCVSRFTCARPAGTPRTQASNKDADAHHKKTEDRE